MMTNNTNIVKKAKSTAVFNESLSRATKSHGKIDMLLTQLQLAVNLNKKHCNSIKSELKKTTDPSVSEYTTAALCKNKFISDYSALLKQRFVFHNSKVNYTWDLRQIIDHARTTGSRSKQVFIALKWMNKKGQFTNNTPKALKDAYKEFQSKQVVEASSVPKK